MAKLLFQPEPKAAQKKRAKPVPGAKGYFYGRGSRKRATARVRLYPKGTGKLTINGNEIADPVIQEPLVLTGLDKKVDVTVRVVGGGMTGQKEATRMGIARAMIAWNPELRTTLRKSGFLTRDPREKERKKYGLKRARRAPQWQKR
jgi:small subunit ribosomal protein S9